MPRTRSAKARPRPRKRDGLRLDRMLDTRSIPAALKRFVKLMQSDPMLCFLRCDRDQLIAALDATLEAASQTRTDVDMADLATSVAPRVITREVKRQTRELIEDCLRFRIWKPADLKALSTALMLGVLDERAGALTEHPLWMTMVALSIEDVLALQDSVIPNLRAELAPEPSRSARRPDPESGPGRTHHYLFQPFFQAAHRTARRITDETLPAALPLYEILPMFLAVFQVWAEQSDYGQLSVEMLPSLHSDVLAAFHKSACRTLDSDVQASIAGVLEAAATEAAEAGDAGQRDQLLAAGQFCSAYSWEANPLVSQLLLKLCSTPESCCIGPGAAEALKLASDPTVQDYYHGYGQALLRQGELRGAGRVFAAGLEMLGHHWRGLLDLALVYRALGEDKIARRVFKEALSAPDLTSEGRHAIENEMAGVSRGLSFARL
ncbi:MAG: hypothetical protein HY816_04675 [Candidatus Wallbacteria bacterium]|nr:hypothetical protein [Candidatus Wallbacteria bacterium]